MKDVIFPFPASTSIDHNGRGNTFAPELTKLHCDESASRRWRVEEGGIGCYTCLLPWGFWRSDYAGCEMEGLFSRGMLGKKRKEKGIHELESQWPIMEGICFKQLRIICSDHERGLSYVSDVFILPPHLVD